MNNNAMIKQPYILIFFVLIFVISIIMAWTGHSSWWYVGIVIGFYGSFIALLHYVRIDED
jgi:hypothetical protein